MSITESCAFGLRSIAYRIKSKKLDKDFETRSKIDSFLTSVEEFLHTSIREEDIVNVQVILERSKMLRDLRTSLLELEISIKDQKSFIDMFRNVDSIVLELIEKYTQLYGKLIDGIMESGS